MNMEKEIIRLKGISKSNGKSQVLKSVDMTVNKGDIYGLIGKNGVGKTTLFQGDTRTLLLSIR